MTRTSIIIHNLLQRLLDVIAGRKDPAGLRQGQVLVDGKVVTSELRLSSAYVVQVSTDKQIFHNTWFHFLNSPSSLCFQDDILMGTLSVKENLLFSANLRLNPKHHSNTEKNNRVNAIINDLGLTDCADTKVLQSLHKGTFQFIKSSGLMD